MARKLLQGHSNINWKNQDIVQSNITDKADLVITSYIINELKAEHIVRGIFSFEHAHNLGDTFMTLAFSAASFRRCIAIGS